MVTRHCQWAPDCGVWCAASAALMNFMGLGAMLLLLGINTTGVHGQQHLETVWSPDRGPVITMAMTNHHSCCFSDPISPVSMAKSSDR